MKRVLIILVVSVFAGMVLSSCISNKPCPAYRSVSFVEQTTSQAELPS
ncbi:MAG: hypothetical protein LBF89_05830 [Bacteroidales bacterium]|jgi:hypothetical protein|nr:hypothetical protein [Bacteroidales bacterium]